MVRFIRVITIPHNRRQSVIGYCNNLLTTRHPALRSTTATSTKTSPQNITLHYRKFLAVRPSRSRRTMWAKYPKNIYCYERFQSKTGELYYIIL